MLVVSNTSPLLNLAIIDHLFLLPQQFGHIFVPPAVITELKIDQDLPGSSALKNAIQEGWIKTHSVDDTALINLLRRDLDQGESEAIALAIQLSATKILLDERDARQIARSLGLSMTGVLGILLRGRQEGTVGSIKDVTERLRTEASFHISSTLLTEMLMASNEV